MALTTDQWIEIGKLGASAVGGGLAASAQNKTNQQQIAATQGRNLADIIRGGLEDQKDYAGRVMEAATADPYQKFRSLLRAGFSSDVSSGLAGNKLTADEINRATGKGEVPQFGFNLGQYLKQYNTAPYMAQAENEFNRNMQQYTGGLAEAPQLSDRFGVQGEIYDAGTNNLKRAILTDRLNNQSRAEQVVAGQQAQAAADKKKKESFWSHGFGKALKTAGKVAAVVAPAILTGGASLPLTMAIMAGSGAASGALSGGGWKGALLGAGLGAAGGGALASTGANKLLQEAILTGGKAAAGALTNKQGQAAPMVGQDWLNSPASNLYLQSLSQPPGAMLYR